MADLDGGQVLDLYKLGVEMADRVSARRAAANTYFVSIQTAVMAAVSFLASREPRPDGFLIIATSLVGVFGAAVWFLLLRSYRDLNRAKFAVITSIEEQLPVRLFVNEWDSLRRDPVKRWRGRYAELGSVERLAPALFAILHIAVAIYLGRS